MIKKLSATPRPKNYVIKNVHGKENKKKCEHSNEISAYDPRELH